MKNLYFLIVAFAFSMSVFGQDSPKTTIADMETVFAQPLPKKQQRKVNKLFRKRGELYFKFEIKDKSEISTLTRIISIDNVKGNTVWAYANKKEFSKFIRLNYKYEVLPAPSSIDPQPTSNTFNLHDKSWSTYPSYTAYEAIMNQFVTDHPNICQLHNIGTLPSGRKLWTLKITDNVNVKEDEPQFLYTSTMHGDETAGYVGMLNYIDYLLTNYGTNARVTNLVNSMEIWINPLANPDGTYAGGNNTVNGATRSNANNIDLNRNYPDFVSGAHPDGNAYQPETLAFMAFADSMHFVMAANFHGGAEVVNYPWDTKSALHADDNWWQRVSKIYADTVFANSPAGYMKGISNTGYTNGFAWYEANGTRQDYMNFFKNCREVTVELSNTKLLAASQLLNNYNYNYRSWLNYMEEALHGFRGIVTDACTQTPMEARVFITGHDFDSSHVYSALPVGNYHRPIFQGTYNVTFSAPGYVPQTVNNVNVTNFNSTIVNINLAQALPSPVFAYTMPDPCGSTVGFSDLTGSGSSWEWNFGDGTTESVQNPTHTYNTPGTYTVKLIVTNCVGTDSVEQTVNIQSAGVPTVQSASACGNSSLTLGAAGNGTLNWYDVPTGGSSIGTGTQFTTPTIGSTTTYYVENTVGSPTQYVGAADNNIGTGGFFTGTTYHYLRFTSTSAFKLVSVWVNANTAGNRTVELRNSAGTVLQSAVVNIPAGGSRITLNFNVPIGTDLQLGVAGNNGLFRNQTGASYPYTLNGVVSITGNSANNGVFYYYFYNWEIAQSCSSARVPVQAVIFPVPTTPTITQNGSALSSDATSGNQWYNTVSGIIIGATGQTYTPTATGSYYVLVTDANGCVSGSSNSIDVIISGVESPNEHSFSLLPNPTQGEVKIDLSKLSFVQANIEVLDVLGRSLFVLQTSEKLVTLQLQLAKGVYFVKISNSDNGQFFTKKLIFE